MGGAGGVGGLSWLGSRSVLEVFCELCFSGSAGGYSCWLGMLCARVLLVMMV